MKNKIIVLIALFLIIAISIFLRFYNLDKIPPSLNWDEVAAGYNAYTIANWGRDEYGIKFPITFKSFEDYKHPVHIYVTSLFVEVFGLNDYAVRSSSAFIGVLAVLAIFIFVYLVTNNKITSLFSSLFLAVSSYHIHFSRGLWEANFALSLFIIGLSVFYVGVKKYKYLIPFSFFLFGLSFFSYHSAKLIVPPIVLILCLLNIKTIIANKKIVALSSIVFLFFGSLIIKDNNILGFARMNQTKFSEEVINKYGGKNETIINNYKQYFTYNYLFEKGDQSPRGSVKVVGQFYKIDSLLIIFGFLYLLLTKKWKELLIIFTTLFLAPIPGAVSSVDPNATRTIFLIFPVIVLSALGAGYFVNFFKNSWTKAIVILIIMMFLSKEVTNYLNYYFNTYPKREAIEWQYGMKEIVGYIKSNPNYQKVYVDNIRQQPYIFFLYYLKTPLSELLKTVKYDQSQSKSFNTVLSFSKYQFGNWDIIESYPNMGIYYVVTPSYYGGLRYFEKFEVLKLIKYPDGSDAFYIVEGYE